jgi:GNAT superfamily N-acetyltransferase
MSKQVVSKEREDGSIETILVDAPEGMPAYFLVDEPELETKGPLRRVQRHASPIHPGTGSDQSVHDPMGGRLGKGDTRLPEGVSSPKRMFNYDDVALAVKSVRENWPPGDAHYVAVNALEEGIGEIAHQYVWERDGEVVGVASISIEETPFTIEALETMDAPDLEGDKLIQLMWLASNERGMGTAMMQWAVNVAAARGHGLWIYAEPEAVGFYEKMGMRNPADSKTGDPVERFFYFTADETRKLAISVERAVPDIDEGDEPANGVYAVQPVYDTVERHASPIHPGTGTDQQVHAGDGKGNTGEQKDLANHLIFMWGEQEFSRLEPGKFWITPDGRITGEMAEHGLGVSFGRAFPMGFIRSLYSPSNNEIYFDFRGGTLTDSAKDTIENITHFYSRLGVDIGGDIQNPDWKPGQTAVEYLRNADELLRAIDRPLIERRSRIEKAADEFMATLARLLGLS